jgi:hypothetical protein
MLRQIVGNPLHQFSARQQGNFFLSSLLSIEQSGHLARTSEFRFKPFGACHFSDSGVTH